MQEREFESLMLHHALLRQLGDYNPYKIEAEGPSPSQSTINQNIVDKVYYFLYNII